MLKRDAISAGSGTMDLLNDVENSCAMVVDILDDLLTYEQLDTITDSLVMASVQIKPILEHKFAIFEERARESKIEFAVSCTARFSASACVIVDQERIKQVLRHILSNANDSAGENGKVGVVVDIVSVPVGLGVHMMHRRELRIEVKDSGDAVSEVTLRPYFSLHVQKCSVH